MAGTITDKLNLLQQTKADMKAALIEKGQSPGDVFAEYPNMIRAISSGGSGGIVPTGTKQITANGTYDVTNYAFAEVNVPTGGGGSSSASPKAVNFRDYDGTVLHSYTQEQALALSALPPLPTQSGLTCQGWNWSLADMQTYVGKYGICEVGATYITDDGKTRLYITIAAEGRMTVPLYISQTVANGVTIDWGDGSATQTLAGTGNVNTTHTYASVGDYVITLAVASGCTLAFGAGSSAYCVMGSTGNNGLVYCNMLRKVEIGEHVGDVGNYAFAYCQSLASIVIPNGSRLYSAGALRNCYSLTCIVVPNTHDAVGANIVNSCYSLSIIVYHGMCRLLNAYSHGSCYALSRVVLPEKVSTLGQNAFASCYSLVSVVIPGGLTSIGSNAFSNCYGMAVYDFTHHTVVPTLSNANAFNGIPSDCVIKVPSALYNEWIAATNWSTYASHIVAA